MMWDFSLAGAFGAMRRTLPFILFRMAVYFGIALLYIFATGAGSGLGYAFTSFGDGDARGAGALYGALFGFAGASGVLYLAREYILYIVKAGHIAVLVKHMDGEELPDGRNQLTYAASVVKERFAETSILFALDQLIKGVLGALTGIINFAAMLIPIPGVNNVVRIINAILKMSLTYVDEIILAHNIRIGSTNPWATSRDALILYAQNYRSFLKNAVWLWLFMWLLTLVIFLVLLGPVLALLAIAPGNMGFVAFMVAFVFAWSFKAALLEPLAIYALMQVYFQKIEGQVPNPEWEERLTKASDKFRKLKDKAIAQVTGGGSGGGDAGADSGSSTPPTTPPASGAPDAAPTS